MALLKLMKKVEINRKERNLTKISEIESAFNKWKRFKALKFEFILD